MPEYKFTVGKCGYCGQKLSGKKVELAGMRGSIPMGRCPKCGQAYPLEDTETPAEPPEEPEEPAEPETNPEEPTEEPTETEEKPPEE